MWYYGVHWWHWFHKTCSRGSALYVTLTVQGQQGNHRVPFHEERYWLISIWQYVYAVSSSFFLCPFSVVTDFSFMFSREQKQQFKELVEVKFHEWLLETGHRQELDSLIPPTIASLKDSNGPEMDTTQVTDAKHVRTGRAVGQSPMACWILMLVLF